MSFKTLLEIYKWIDRWDVSCFIINLHCSIARGELVECILSENCLTEGIVVGYLQQLLHALEYIHFNKVIHLDIKVLSQFILAT